MRTSATFACCSGQLVVVSRRAARKQTARTTAEKATTAPTRSRRCHDVPLPGCRRGAKGLRRVSLPDGALHLDLDQTVHLDRVLERELLDDRLDEAGHHHRRGFGFG